MRAGSSAVSGSQFGCWDGSHHPTLLLPLVPTLHDPPPTLCLADIAKWESAVADRDAELQNLQRALGELSYESDAGEWVVGW